METIEFPRDFSEFLKSLDDHRVEHLLVGGFAVALYGYPRATADMDIWVARRRENAVRLLECLDDFGFPTTDLTVEMLQDETCIVRMGVAPLRIDVLTSIDGVDFDECLSHATTHSVDGVEVPVISLEDLKTNKRASGRAKDLDDIVNLP